MVYVHVLTRKIGLLALMTFCCLLSASNNPHSTIYVDEVTLPNGLTMEYAEKGHGQGKVVLFIHGYLHSMETFRPLMEALGPQYHAYAVSLRGHGDSGKPLTNYGIDDMAADVVAFMDQVGIHRATIVGHSMGGAIAQRIAIDHGDRVKKLALLGTVANAGANISIQEFLYFTQILVDPIDPSLVYFLYITRFFYITPSAYLDFSAAETLKVPARVWRDALAGLAAANTEGELGLIDVPTLIVWGDRDSIFTAAEQQVLHEGIAGSELLIYAETGHDLHLEQVAQLVIDLEDFMH